MLRRAVGPLMAMSLVAIGCSSGDGGGGVGLGGGGRTVTVDVDGRTASFVASFVDYFPREVTVRPGDTVEFASTYTGEPHTVTLGTLVDQGLAAADATPAAPSEPPDLQKIPNLLPKGPGNANQAAAQPCFLATGDPPADAACTEDQQRQPDFDGTQTYYNSGWLPDKEVFKVKLADDIRPGTYRYFCTLHRAAHQGRITVAPSGGDGQTGSEVTEAGDDQRQAVVDQLLPLSEALKTGTLPPIFPTPQPATVISGSGAEGVTGTINEFGPKDFAIPVGGAMTWVMVGPHTVSFNVPPDAATYISEAPDGSVNLNPKAADPAGGPGPPPGPPPAAPPPGGRLPPPTIVDGGSFDGTGFRSTGVFASFPPNLLGYRLTFTKAGTFSYVCLVHPGQVGTVKVG